MYTYVIISNSYTISIRDKKIKQIFIHILELVIKFLHNFSNIPFWIMYYVQYVLRIVSTRSEGAVFNYVILSYI